jgi:hypothetical protein
MCPPILMEFYFDKNKQQYFYSGKNIPMPDTDNGVLSKGTYYKNPNKFNNPVFISNKNQIVNFKQKKNILPENYIKLFQNTSIESFVVQKNEDIIFATFLLEKKEGALLGKKRFFINKYINHKREVITKELAYKKEITAIALNGNKIICTLKDDENYYVLVDTINFD